MTRYELILLDVCLPGFFNGHDGEVMAIPVDGAMNLNDLKSEMKDDLNTIMREDFDYAAAEEAIDALGVVPDSDPEKPIFPGLAPYIAEEEFDGECVYAYFAFQEGF